MNDILPDHKFEVRVNGEVIRFNPLPPVDETKPEAEREQPGEQTELSKEQALSLFQSRTSAEGYTAKPEDGVFEVMLREDGQVFREIGQVRKEEKKEAAPENPNPRRK